MTQWAKDDSITIKLDFSEDKANSECAYCGVYHIDDGCVGRLKVSKSGDVKWISHESSIAHSLSEIERFVRYIAWEIIYNHDKICNG